jgi:hypothetical protein
MDNIFKVIKSYLISIIDDEISYDDEVDVEIPRPPPLPTRIDLSFLNLDDYIKKDGYSE